MNPANETREARLSSLMVAAQRGDAQAYARFLREAAVLWERLTEAAEYLGVSYRHLQRIIARFCDEGILERIALGESCALCSDAGTPAVSDPGEVLVRQAKERGL